MGEIQFRAWDKASKKMFEPYWLDNTENCTPYEDGGWNNPEPIYYDEKKDGYVLMQYTGLKDVKGVDIYDGDIVRADCGLYPRLKIWTIVFDNACFRLKHIKEFASCPLNTKYVEVIGNIYENKELLND